MGLVRALAAQSDDWAAASQGIPNLLAKASDGIHPLPVSESSLSRHAREVLWLRAFGSYRQQGSV
jgi:hypothetical protein